MSNLPDCKRSPVERKKIHEIIARLKLEPKIKEIYVEGVFDRDFYRNALAAVGMHDFQIYPISVVNVSNEMLQELNLTSGERQRVEAAAEKFKEHKSIHSQIVFLIDADTDYVKGVPEPRPPLMRTKTSCVEVIIWKKDILEKFFSLALGRQNYKIEVDNIVPFVEKIVEDLFIFRAAKEIEAPKWVIPEISDTLERKKDFSFQKYCERVASKNSSLGGHRLLNEKILPRIDALREKCSAVSISQRLHGHDLFGVLARKLEINGLEHGCLKNSEELARMILASLEWGALESDPTIREVAGRFS